MCVYKCFLKLSALSTLLPVFPSSAVYSMFKALARDFCFHFLSSRVIISLYHSMLQTQLFLESLSTLLPCSLTSVLCGDEITKQPCFPCPVLAQLDLVGFLAGVWLLAGCWMHA